MPGKVASPRVALILLPDALPAMVVGSVGRDVMMALLSGARARKSGREMAAATARPAII